MRLLTTHWAQSLQNNSSIAHFFSCWIVVKYPALVEYCRNAIQKLISLVKKMFYNFFFHKQSTQCSECNVLSLVHNKSYTIFLTISYYFVSTTLNRWKHFNKRRFLFHFSLSSFHNTAACYLGYNGISGDWVCVYNAYMSLNCYYGDGHEAKYHRERERRAQRMPGWSNKWK